MSEASDKVSGPHQGQPLLTAGEALEKARAAMIMIHGRGASAEDILELAAELKQPGFVFLAPQASGHTWYPNSFLAPIESNEPGLSSGLAVIAALLERLAGGGIPAGRTVLLGVSPGAGLTPGFAARNAPRYGGVGGFCGGAVGCRRA